MTYSLLHRTLLVIGAFLSITAPCVKAAEVRPITVETLVRTADGDPLPDVPVQHVTMNGVAFGLTDANGRLMVTLDADRAETKLFSRIWDGTWHDAPADQLALAERRYEELRTGFSFEVKYLRALDANADNYAVEIIAYPTITVSGRLVDAAGATLAGTLGSIRCVAYDNVEPEEQGVFSIRGVRRGESERLVAQRIGSGQVHMIDLNPVQTSTDVALGDVVIEDTPADCSVAVSMSSHADLFDSSLMSLGGAATFISADAGYVGNFPASPDGGVLRETFYVPARRPLLPPGAYYVAPGGFGTRASMAVYLSILNGRQAALDAAGVPRITAVSGQEASLEFDARAAYDAIIQVGGDLVD